VLEKYPKDVRLAHKFIAAHAFSMKAATAALAAYDQGKFWEFHDQLFANQDDLDDEKLIEIASLLKLDLPRFREKMKDPKLEDMVDGDYEEAMKLGVDRTPWIYMNGRHIEHRTLQGLSDAVDEELADIRKASQPQGNSDRK
jgi:protein-disulfide isomerase